MFLFHKYSYEITPCLPGNCAQEFLRIWRDFWSSIQLAAGIIAPDTFEESINTILSEACWLMYLTLIYVYFGSPCTFEGVLWRGSSGDLYKPMGIQCMPSSLTSNLNFNAKNFIFHSKYVAKSQQFCIYISLALYIILYVAFKNFVFSEYAYAFGILWNFQTQKTPVFGV